MNDPTPSPHPALNAIIGTNSGLFDLRNPEGRMACLISNLQNGIFIEDSNRKLLLINAKCVEMFGNIATPEEMLGIDLKDSADKYKNIFMDPESFLQRSEQLFKAKTKILQEIIHLKDGRIIERDFIPVFSGNQYTGSLWVFNDVTGRTHIENQRENLLKNIERQNDILNRYGHLLSHGLKAPVRNMASLITWIQEEIPENISVQNWENLMLLKRCIEKMDHLIENITQYSNIETQPVNKKEIDLNIFVTELIETLNCPKSINLIVKTLPKVNADERHMHQLFTHLLKNAIEHCNTSNGQVKISCTDDRSFHIFCISDNGKGIAPKHQERIFNIFKSLQSDNTSSGIGLAIVKKITLYYNGELWLKSSLGYGASFYFSLPKKRVATL